MHQPLFNLRFFHDGHSPLEARMSVDRFGPSAVEGSGVVECHMPLLPLTPKICDVEPLVRSDDGITDLIERRIVARIRVTDQGPDAVPLRRPMAITHLGRSSPVLVPRTWHFCKESELTNTVESRRS